MTNIFDLASSFLTIESMSHKKLQKLCYYAKAWHLALYDEDIIPEHFEAWVHGPVCRILYEKYKKHGKDDIPNEINSASEGDDWKIFVRQVYDAYGYLDGDELESITHSEKPWIEARGDKKPWESCSTIISNATMQSFYKGKQINAA